MVNKYRGSVACAREMLDNMTRQYTNCDACYHWSPDTVKFFRPTVLTVQVKSEDGRIVAVGTIERMTRPDRSISYRAQWATVGVYDWHGVQHHRVNTRFEVVDTSRAAYSWLKANIP